VKYPDKYRMKKGPFATMDGDQKGLFFVRRGLGEIPLKVVASPPDGEWQHVSVSLPNKCPTWNEMCKIKELFWDDDETVMQLHVPTSQHINMHPFCLHLWRENNNEFKLPPSILVGLK